MFRWALIPLFLLLFLILGSLIALICQLSYVELRQVITDPEFHFAIGMSLSTALTSLCLAIILGVPAAWAMVRIPFKGHRFIDALLDLPLVTPPLVIGIGLLLLLGNQGPLAGVLPELSRSLFSPLGIIIAQTYVASAIIMRNSLSAFKSVDPAYIQTAQNLGLTPTKTFFLIEIPLCWPALMSGSIIAFSRALGEFGATLMLAGATRLKTETLPMAIYLNIASGDFTLAIGCALVLIAIAITLLFALHRLQRERKRSC
ncbi:ABC transporter permease [Proteus terrae]|uniref:ABC transporter permease n=1 Tax=Proteus terrae TaxID=1574161 RepID=UPI00224828B9|nr:ABC transporter permease [Proteus terrae]